jgi:hypothetical protein
MTRSRFLITGIAIAVSVATLVMASPRAAEAIPAFARTHNVPCTTCHVAFPKLNHFGEEFEHRGFRMPGAAGKYLWEQPVPLAGRINVLASGETNRWDPQPPAGSEWSTDKSGLSLFDWQLLTGGTLAPDVSFFGQLVGKVQGLGPDDSDAAAEHTDHGTTTLRTEVFFVQLNDVYGENGTMNVRAGIDHVDNHFLSTPLRLTHADYLIQIQPGHTGASLHPLAAGIGANGSFHDYGLDYDIGVRNYSPFYDSNEGDEHRLGAFYAVLNKQLAEHTVSFLFSEDRNGNANLNEDGITLAWGVSMDIRIGRLEFIPGLYWYRDDSGGSGGDTGTDPGTDPDTDPGTDPGTDPDHDHDGGTTGHAESFAGGLGVFSGTLGVTYQFKPTLLGTLRYDFNDFDVKSEPVNRAARQYVASLAWYQHPNVRWITEVSRLNTNNLAMTGEPGLASLVTADSNLTQTKYIVRLDVGF